MAIWLSPRKSKNGNPILKSLQLKGQEISNSTNRKSNYEVNREIKMSTQHKSIKRSLDEKGLKHLILEDKGKGSS